MKIFVVALILFLNIFVFTLPKVVQAEDSRFAACDLCGYCPGPMPPSPTPYQPNPPPESWPKCAACLYNVGATGDDTRRIDPETNNPPTPIPGRMYTVIGCIRTDLEDGFANGGSSGIVVQYLLTYLIFSTVGGIAFLYFLYGAFLVLTSQADPQQLNRGKSIALGAIVGLVFSLSAVFLVNLIAKGVLRIPGFG